MIDEDTTTENTKDLSKTTVSAQKMIEEIEFTDQIQSILEYGNQYKLRSFKLRLVMEHPEETTNKVLHTGIEENGLL